MRIGTATLMQPLCTSHIAKNVESPWGLQEVMNVAGVKGTHRCIFCDRNVSNTGYYTLIPPPGAKQLTHRFCTMECLTKYVLLPTNKKIKLVIKKMRMGELRQGKWSFDRACRVVEDRRKRKEKRGEKNDDWLPLERTRASWRSRETRATITRWELEAISMAHQNSPEVWSRTP